MLMAEASYELKARQIVILLSIKSVRWMVPFRLPLLPSAMYPLQRAFTLYVFTAMRAYFLLPY